MLLENKTSVITGCSRGIGKAILEDFAKHGSNVIVVVRSENMELWEYCKNLSEKYQVSIDLVYADFQSDDNGNDSGNFSD